MNIAVVILRKRMEATIEIMRYKSGKKIDKELKSMMNSYMSALALIDGSNDRLYWSPYFAIMALRRELSSVKWSDELTDEINSVIKLLKDEESKELSE